MTEQVVTQTQTQTNGAASGVPAGEQAAEQPKGTATAVDPAGTPAAEAAPAAEADKLARANEAAKRARQGASKYKQLAAERDRIAAQARTQAQHTEQLQQQLRQQAQREEQLKRDPYAALKQLGMTEEQLVQRALAEGTPQQQVQAVLQELDKERQARVALENRIQQRESLAQRQDAETKLVSAASDEAKYPNLSKQPPKIVVQAAIAMLQEAAGRRDPNTGLPIDVNSFSYDDICHVLELLWASHSKSKATASRPKDESKKVDPEAAPEKKPQSKTLTNKLSQQAFSRPDNWDQLPERVQLRMIAQMVDTAGLAGKRTRH